MLTIPLATLLGLAENPGEAHGWGAIDPALARQTAASAARHPRCACNGGCRCRRDHRVKQSPGWSVTQPRPGYHQWTTPSGRTYTSEPTRYPI